MNNSQILHQKLLLQEHLFLKFDLEYKTSIVFENQNDFLNLVYQNSDIPQDDRNKEVATAFDLHEEKNKMSQDLQEKIKKMYREISKVAHPDRDPSGRYVEVFSIATIAYEQFKIFDLYHCCDRLSLPFEISEPEIILLNEEISIFRTKIQEVEKSLVYIWHTQSDPKIKNLLVEAYALLLKQK